MGRKRQLGVALDDQVRSLLENLASKSDRSIADEIRNRIERTIDQDLFDPATRKLGLAIMELARGIQENSGCRWYEQPKAHEALAEGVATLLDGLKPPASAPTEDQWGPDDPRTVGRLLARSTLRRTKEIERDEQSTSLQFERLRGEMTARQDELKTTAKRHAAAVERMIAKPAGARSKKGRKS
jgi:hypothetical protein